MTAGHPDWQTYADWRGGPIVSNSSFGMSAGGNSFGIVPLAHFSGVTLKGTATDRAVMFIANFYADAGGLFLVERLSWCCPIGVSVSVNVPALGPYFEGFVTNLGAAGGHVSIYIEPTNVATQSTQYMTDATPQPLAFINASLGAGAGTTAATSEVYEGECYLMTSTSSGAVYQGSVQWFDEVTLGNIILFRYVGSNLGQGGTIGFAAPPTQLTVGVTNSDTVARTLNINIHRAH